MLIYMLHHNFDLKWSFLNLYLTFIKIRFLLKYASITHELYHEYQKNCIHFIVINQAFFIILRTAVFYF